MATLCHRGWRPAGTISDLQSATAILFFAIASALLKCGGQLGSTNHSGWTAMDTSFHRGWLVFEQRVQCGSAFVCYMVHLEAVLLCEALSGPTVSIGRCHSMLRAFASSPL